MIPSPMNERATDVTSNRISFSRRAWKEEEETNERKKFFQGNYYQRVSSSSSDLIFARLATLASDFVLDERDSNLRLKEGRRVTRNKKFQVEFENCFQTIESYLP